MRASSRTDSNLYAEQDFAFVLFTLTLKPLKVSHVHGKLTNKTVHMPDEVSFYFSMSVLTLHGRHCLYSKYILPYNLK